MKLTCEEYEKIYQRASEEAEELLKRADYEKIYNLSDPRAVEIMFWAFVKNYVENEIDINTFIEICNELEADPIFYNMSREARVAMLDGIKLDKYLYQEPNQEKISEINNYLREDVDNFYGIWYLNFKD
jgi:hypothetical protein